MSNVFQVVKEEWNDLQNVKIDLGMYGRTMLSFNNVRRILEDVDWCFTTLDKHLVEYLKNTRVEYCEWLRDDNDNVTSVYICYVRK